MQSWIAEALLSKEESCNESETNATSRGTTPEKMQESVPEDVLLDELDRLVRGLGVRERHPHQKSDDT